MIALRPCGACTALVPADTGCPHWRPGESARQTKARELRRRDAEELAAARAEQDRKREEFRRQLGVPL